MRAADPPFAAFRVASFRVSILRIAFLFSPSVVAEKAIKNRVHFVIFIASFNMLSS